MVCESMHVISVLVLLIVKLEGARESAYLRQVNF